MTLNDFAQLLKELWAYEFVQYIVAGLVVALGLLILPPRFLKWIGRKPLLSPNWISFWRLPICWIGYYLYILTPEQFTGYLLIVGGLTLDRLDGKIAKLLDLETEMGKWLDPLIDKLTLPPFIVWMTIQGIGSVEAAALIAVFDLAGTLIRQPFGFWSDRLRDPKATGIGKLKMAFQAIFLLTSLPFHQGWFTEHIWVLDLILWLTATFGLLSVISKINFRGSLKWLNEAVDMATYPFQHEET